MRSNNRATGQTPVGWGCNLSKPRSSTAIPVACTASVRAARTHALRNIGIICYPRRRIGTEPSRPRFRDGLSVSRTAADFASRAKPGTNRPRTADRRLSEPVACAFAGMPRAAPGGRHSPSQPPHGRSAGVGRIERWTKRSLACLPIGLRLRVFSHVDHFLLGHLEDTVLGNGKPADIAPGVAQEVFLGHFRGEVDMPIIPLHLLMDEFVEISEVLHE